MKRTTTIVALATLALAMLVASATDWQQFQKDESNIGWTNYTPNSLSCGYRWAGAVRC